MGQEEEPPSPTALAPPKVSKSNCSILSRAAQLTTRPEVHCPPLTTITSEKNIWLHDIIGSIAVRDWKEMREWDTLPGRLVPEVIPELKNGREEHGGVSPT